MFKSIKRQRVSDEIVNQVKSLISQGTLKPGDRLPPERELIKEFGVSRPSIREALTSLVAQGFLEVKQGNRTFVKSVTSEKIQDPLSLLLNTDTQKIFDLIEVRKEMEAWGAFHAAQRVSEEDIERLRYVKALMSDCGVNLAGVEVALRLMQRMRDMQEQLEELERRISRVGETEMEDVIEDIIEDAEWNEI